MVKIEQENSSWSVFIGRSMISGYGSSVAPTYINEVSPLHLRGTLGVTFQLGVVVTLFFAQVISLHEVLGAADKWNFALGKVLNIDFPC